MEKNSKKNRYICIKKMFSCYGIKKLVFGDLVTMNLLQGIILYYKSILGVCKSLLVFPLLTVTITNSSL